MTIRYAKKFWRGAVSITTSQGLILPQDLSDLVLGL